ncbi:MAG: hypothetical protein RMJ44_08245 [Cytophagales bacterium]|nr:hypothetical protein [Bernardetiaceae bacterium]MDW8211063.1 hypothetical protein [Cytophagales bacterium]
MAKLKNIIKQLSNKDYEIIYNSLIESNAEKSATLLRAIREKQLSDSKIMEELEVNTNAYYTLRSRLNQKIEEYLLQQMESPRTDILKRVININETIFTRKKAIAIATLKRLERELLDYDLSNELTIVYKHLKRLHINSPDYFSYSQAYNRHVAYMLAIDKAEDMLADYFKKFGIYTLTGEEMDKMQLVLLNQEMQNIARLYKSHRLYVYQSCMNVFHRLFVEEEKPQDDLEPIEDIIEKVDQIFSQYNSDPTYYHLKLVFDYLRLEYYNHHKVFKKAERYFEDVNDSAAMLLSNYTLYTYPSRFLMTKLERSLRLGIEQQLYQENEALFEDFEVDQENIPEYVSYMTYRAICCYYAEKYEEAARWLNALLNEVNLKKYQHATLEVKSLLALQYCLQKDFELFSQLINSIQRQIRAVGKEECFHIVIFNKILKIATTDGKKDRIIKIRSLAARIPSLRKRLFSPTKYILFDEKLINKLSQLAV